MNPLTYNKIKTTEELDLTSANTDKAFEYFEKVQEAVTEPLQELESKLREAMLGGASTTGEIIDLEDFIVASTISF